MRVLVFGASTVQGFWDEYGGWADRLKIYYQKKQIDDFNAGRMTDLPKIMNLGISGDGTAELLKRVEIEAGARQNPKGLSFIISIGSNNAAILNGSPVSTPEEYVDQLKQIVNILQKYSNKILIVGFPAVDESKTTPLPWADMHFRNERILTIENAAKELAQRLSIPFVPVIERFKKEVDAGRKLQSHDGLHPSSEGHQLIFELVQTELDKMLNT